MAELLGEPPESVTLVFSLPELQEVIFERVINYKSSFTTNTPEDEIHNLRLVSTGWLIGVHKLCCVNGTPLIKLNLTENAIILDEFVQEFGLGAPTFSLNISEAFFQNGHFSSLENCLVECGNGLVELEMHLENTTDLPCVLEEFELPILKKLTIEIIKPTIQNTCFFDDFKFHCEMNRESKMCGNMKVGNLLKKLIMGSTSLRELTLLAEELEPIGFSGLVMPQSINKLHIRIHDNNEIETLTGMKLPVVSNLDLEIYDCEVGSEEIYNVLDKWRTSLKELNLSFSNYEYDSDEDLTQVCFPVLAEVKKLKFSGLISFHCDKLQDCLPKIQNLDLSLTESDFYLWNRNSVFTHVSSLAIELYKFPTSIDQPLPMSFENMENINHVFPNLEKVKLSVLGNETCVMKYIFKEMKNLKKLELKVSGTGNIKSSDFWDALIIGTSPEAVKAVRLDGFELEDAEITNAVSLRSLNVLEELHLKTVEISELAREGRLLISELAFTHGFLRMPELRVLGLSGRFKLSAEVLGGLGIELPNNLTLV